MNPWLWLLYAVVALSLALFAVIAVHAAIESIRDDLRERRVTTLTTLDDHVHVITPHTFEDALRDYREAHRAEEQHNGEGRRTRVALMAALATVGILVDGPTKY